jgi:hypothetical protein
MLLRDLDLDARLTIDGPGSRLTLTGRGRSMVLETDGVPSFRGPLNLMGISRRHAGRVARILEATGLTLHVTRSGRRVASLGSGVRESKLMSLAGVRGVRLHYGALVRTLRTIGG